MSEPGTTLRFSVTLDNHQSLGTWTKCEGLAVEYEIFEYQEGGQNEYVHRLPGRCKYTNVKLTRPLDAQSPRTSPAGCRAGLTRCTGTTRRSRRWMPSGDEIAQWNLATCVPRQMDGSRRWMRPATRSRPRSSSSRTTDSCGAGGRRKAKLVDADGKRLEFRFNPKEYTLAKAATWNRPTNKGAKSSTKPEFGGVQPQSVSSSCSSTTGKGMATSRRTSRR